MLPRLPFRIVLPALALAIPGCALIAPTAETTVDDAHVVFLTRAECAYHVVKTQGDSFGILAPVEPVSIRQGDMFVGALRSGRITLRFLPFPDQELGPPMTVDVRAAAIPLAQAQSQWRELCG